MWTTQNIVASGTKAMTILLSQELYKNCLHILNCSVEHEGEAMQLLDLIIEYKWQELESDDRQSLQQSVFQVLKKRSDDPIALQVVYKIMKLNGGWSFNPEDSEIFLIMLAESLHSANPTDEDALCFTVKILMLSFLHDPNNVVIYCRFLCNHKYKLSELINIVTSTPKYFNTLKDLLHFTAFLHTNQHPTVAQFVATDPLVNLKVPKLFEF